MIVRDIDHWRSETCLEISSITGHSSEVARTPHPFISYSLYLVLAFNLSAVGSTRYHSHLIETNKSRQFLIFVRPRTNQVTLIEKRR